MPDTFHQARTVLDKTLKGLEPLSGQRFPLHVHQRQLQEQRTHSHTWRHQRVPACRATGPVGPAWTSSDHQRSRHRRPVPWWGLHHPTERPPTTGPPRRPIFCEQASNLTRDHARVRRHRCCRLPPPAQPRRALQQQLCRPLPPSRRSFVGRDMPRTRIRSLAHAGVPLQRRRRFSRACKPGAWPEPREPPASRSQWGS